MRNICNINIRGHILGCILYTPYYTLTVIVSQVFITTINIHCSLNVSLFPLLLVNLNSNQQIESKQMKRHRPLFNILYTTEEIFHRVVSPKCQINKNIKVNPIDVTQNCDILILNRQIRFKWEKNFALAFFLDSLSWTFRSRPAIANSNHSCRSLITRL